MSNRVLRRFSFSSSIKEFIEYVSVELFSAGCGSVEQQYYTIYGENTRVEVKELERPHSPIIELMFIGMLCILCTVVFKCAVSSMKSRVFNVSVGCLYINFCLSLITVVLVCLEFRKLYKAESV
ncbi:hypothetical protein NEIG_01083 [Nematocida sp. ERTm5]|nr:hypothetical protein NEIRO02_1964 [Nematocida sp. AWRm79]KAI5185158.1 hypothetical protein NEIRO03_1936 [Nematocida sp. AWRm78]OAG30050.1 hypothetical protein NEIG_01083 [Nematocida sp. ERTm5]